MARANPEALAALIEGSGVEFKTNRRSYIFTCPRCDKAGKLLMFKADGRFICWVCAETSGFRGKPEYALTELLGLPIRDIQTKLYEGGEIEDLAPEGYFQVRLRDFFDEDEELPEDLEHIQRAMKYPLDFYEIDHPFAKNGRVYLEKRGIDLELAKFYDLRYSPLQRRVIFPIKVGEKVFGWQARAIFQTTWEDSEGNTKECPKMLTTGKRDSILMFQDRLAGAEAAVICEGPVDAIKCHLAGGNVATMGKVVSRQQIKIIAGSGVKKIYLGLDPDAATETMKLCQEFSGLRVYRLLPQKGYKDLGEMSLEAVREQFKTAPRIYSGQLFLHLGA